jgi:hypothetical protein
VLGRDEQRPRRDFFQAAELGLDAADHAQQPQVGAGPERSDGDDAPARHQQRRQRRDDLRKKVEIKQQIEDEGPNDEHEQTRNGSNVASSLPDRAVTRGAWRRADLTHRLRAQPGRDAV